jgi:hypothetical protein
MRARSATPRLIRIYQPDTARCVEALARFLGIGLAPDAPSTVAPPPIVCTGSHSVKRRRERAARPRNDKESHSTRKRTQRNATP